jgi:hypothetical protein
MKELDAPVMESIRRHHKELDAPVSKDKDGAECSGRTRSTRGYSKPVDRYKGERVDNVSRQQ